MDINELYKWRDIFLTDGKLVEIRVLTNGRQTETYSGYFYDIESALPMLQQLENDTRHNFYFTINEPKRACNSRIQFNSFQKGCTTTSKNDIARRWWLAVDIDVKRVSDVASTKEEKEYAHQKALEVFRFFVAEEWPEPVVIDSSSGYHIYIPADLENIGDKDRSELAVKAFLNALGGLFSDDKVKIDTAPCDANRIMRLPGFYGRKGLNTEERPHRIARVLRTPKEITHRITIDELDAFNEKYLPKEEKKTNNTTPRQYRSNSEPFDVEKFLNEHNVLVHSKTTSADGTTKYVLDHCAFNESHRHPDAAIFVMPNGAISYRCLHDSCSSNDWRAFRLLLDPHAYDEKPREYQPRQQYERYRLTKRPPYEFKVENEELGKKWLCTKDVKKIDISQIGKIMTGYTELDSKTRGLRFGEISIVSGSNSSGKSSWLNCVILNAREQGEKSALWSGELQKEVLVSWLQQAAAGKHNEKSKFNDGYYVPNMIAERIDAWLDGWFYLYNNEYGNKWEQIFKDMEQVVEAGVKLLILDNLFSLDIDLFEGDKNSKQKELIIQLCTFAKKNQVHIILVAHPRKSIAFLRKDDISGTSDLGNAVDNIFIIHRFNRDFEIRASDFLGGKIVDELKQYSNIVEVCKCRMFGQAVDSMCGMLYDIKSRQFYNIDKGVVEYGWATETETQINEEYTIPEEAQPLQSTLQPNQAFDTPIEPLYPQKEEDAYWGQFKNDTDNCPF